MKVTRRSFLATTGMAAAVGPLVLGTADKAGIKAPVVGEGDRDTKPRMTGGNSLTILSMGTLRSLRGRARSHYIHHTVIHE